MIPTSNHDIDVPGGTLRVVSFGTGPRPVLAVHGITANAMCWQAVARALPTDWTLHAVDLRGRGHSTTLPGPFGFDAHSADLRRAARALGAEVLIGHSLGAYVALLAADADPDSFGPLLLVDGGLPMPVPAGADSDALLAATLGPALERLSQIYPTPEAYVDFWRGHPALTDWTSDIEDYVRYDLAGEPGALRSRANPEAVRADGRELLTAGDRISAALRRRSGPLAVLRAPAGMFGRPPGLVPEEIVAHWQGEMPGLRVTTVPGANHYSILFAPHAAAQIAELIPQAAAVVSD
ncbi:MAG TPA: alpha/beta hydrolase [Streptosporangiaceae bacterium]|nr:alpha/beta hydrolase [Streptosporangiaceae bacterium]